MVLKMSNENYKNDLMNFVKGFFESIGAEIKIDDGTLIASGIPEDFEKLIGKDGPYTMSFGNPKENTEFITKGSTFLREIMNYVEKKGQTTLIKLDFDRDYKKEFEHYLSLKNSFVQNFSKDLDYKSFARFSITTNLQYLNEKEQITNHICVDNNKIIDFNIDKYKNIEGKKNEVNPVNLKEDYEIAKEELKKLIKIRVEDTAQNLSDKLDRENNRIKKHYDKQRKEFEDSIQKIREQVKNLEVQLEKSKIEEREQIRLKIKRYRENISEMEKSNVLDNLNKEELFFMTDEKNKHSLKINNKLINTTIIYYPIYNFNLILKSKEAVKKIQIDYDPMKDSIIRGVNCESCKREIMEIFVCSNSHVSCANCAEECPICSAVLCLACNKKRCYQCNKKLCKKCYVTCFNCRKEVCRIHSDKNYANDKDYCVNCLERCDNCGKFADKKRIKKLNNSDICEKCFVLRKIK